MSEKVSNFTAAGTLDGTELVGIIKGGVKKTTTQDIADLAGSSAVNTTDTPTIDLEGDGSIATPLTADVKVSAQSGNAAQIVADGIYIPAVIKNGLVYGGIVTWVSDYTYEVSAAGYYIAGIFYQSPARTVANGNPVILSAPDATYSRIDVFFVDTTSAVDVLEGTPSSSPEKPAVSATQIELSFALVETGTTQPTITQEQLYAEASGEPTEWTAATNASARIDVASTATPVEGAISIEATDSVFSDTITITNDAALLIDALTVLIFKIQPKAFTNNGNKKKWRISFRLGASQVGNTVAFSNGSYGFDINSQTVQTISIPLADFGLTTASSIDNLFFENITSISFGSIGFFIDDIKLQGVAVAPPVTGLEIDDTTPSLIKVYSSQKTQDELDLKLNIADYNDRFKAKIHHPYRVTNRLPNCQCR